MSNSATRETLSSIAQEQHKKRIGVQRWIVYREHKVGVILLSAEFWKADMVPEER